jgi:hypothetical protein
MQRKTRSSSVISLATDGGRPTTVSFHRPRSAEVFGNIINENSSLLRTHLKKKKDGPGKKLYSCTLGAKKGYCKHAVMMCRFGTLAYPSKTPLPKVNKRSRKRKVGGALSFP